MVIMRAKNPLSKTYFDQAFVDSFKKTSKRNVFKLMNHYKSENRDSLNPELFNFFKESYDEEFYNLAKVSPKDMDVYVHEKLLRKSRVLNGLALYLYVPYLYKSLIKLGAFSYKYKFI